MELKEGKYVVTTTQDRLAAGVSRFVARIVFYLNLNLISQKAPSKARCDFQ